MKTSSKIQGLGGIVMTLALGLSRAVFATDCDPLPSGAVGWWQGENNAVDTIAGNNGTMMNGAGFATGEVETAFDFDGNNEFLLITSSSSSNLDVQQGTGFTFEEWIKPTTVSTEQIIFEYVRALETGDGFDVGVGMDIHAAGSSGLLFANIADTSGNAHIFASPSGLLAPGVWQHIAMTYDKTSGLAAFYINGAAATVTNFGGFTPQTSFTNLSVGARTTFHSISSPGVPYSGEMDEIGLYNRALSGAEIQAIYQAGSVGKCLTSMPPVIALQPTNQGTAIGTTAVLSVAASGTSPISFQWIFNGTNLVSGTNATLTLTNVQLAQAGNYSVLITNPYGTTNSDFAALTVYGLPPFIVTQPASQSVVVGANVALSVTVSGTAPFTYAWSVNGTNIVGATNATLSLPNVQIDQSGTYAVAVVNQYGSTNSAAAALTVNVAPPCDPPPSGLVAWWAGEGNAYDNVGTNNGTVVGAVGYGNGEVGQGFTLSGSQQMVTVGNPASLRLQNFTIESWVKRSSSTYVHTGGGNGIIFGYGSGGYALYLDPNGTPTLTQIPGPNAHPTVSITDTNFHHLAVTKAGSSVVFYVDGVAYSAPAFYYTFYFYTSAAIGGRSDTLDNSFLGVVDETSVYNRALSATEINAIFQSGSKGKCFAPLPPTITLQPMNQAVPVGGAAIFSVGTAGTSPMSYQWMLNGTNIANATNAVLSLSDLQVSQSGDYTVSITNPYGATNSTVATLNVYGLPPFIASQPGDQTVVIGGTASFSVGATGTDPISYIWAFNGTNIFGATNATLSIANVQTNQVGSYSVLVVNPFGSTNSVAATLTANQPPPCDSVPSGVVAWWQAEGNASDSVANNNGVALNGTGYTTGEVGSAFNFNGSDSIVLINPAAPNSLDVGQSSGFTMECWIKPNNLGNSLEIIAIYERTLGAWDGSNPGVSFLINNIPNNGYFPGCLGVNISDVKNGSHTFGTDANVLQLGVWQHVALTYDKTTGNATLYTNGVTSAQQNLGVFIPQTSFTNLVIGGQTTYGSITGPADPYNGAIDEFGLYNRVLTTNEIFAIFKAGVSGKCPASPTITGQPASQTNLVGTTATFAVTASGMGATTYQWSFNGTNISFATNATLTLTNVQLGQSGDYAVTVANLAGATNSATAILTVVAPPYITQQPQSISVVSYNPASFSVVATGTGPLSYQWQKNGNNLVDNANITGITGSATATLTINSVGVPDAGNYQVVITSPYASTNSAVAVLTVPETVVALGSATGMSGGTVTVPVIVNALGTESAFLGSVSYDPTKLVLQSVVGAVPNYNQTNNGYLGFAIFAPDSTFAAGSNTVAQLIFTALPVTNNTAVPVTFADNPVRRQLTDNNFDDLPAIYQAGSVQLIPAEYCGDVYPRFEGDHQISLQDWQEIGKMVAGLDVPTNSDEMLRADSAPRNAADGILTVADWVQAGRYALGLDPYTLVTLPSSPNVTTKVKPHGGPAGTRTLVVAAVSAPRGQTVNVPVSLICSSNESAVGCTISYAPAQLRLLSVKAGTPFNGGKANINSNQVTGKIGMAMAVAPGLTLPAGSNQVAILQFATSTNASGSLAVTLDDSVAQLQVADSLAFSVPTTYLPGSVILPPQPNLAATPKSGGLQFSWPLASGTFEVQAASQPVGPWTTLVLPLVTNGGNVSVLCWPTNQQQFYRLQGQ